MRLYPVAILAASFAIYPILGILSYTFLNREPFYFILVPLMLTLLWFLNTGKRLVFGRLSILAGAMFLAELISKYVANGFIFSLGDASSLYTVKSFLAFVVLVIIDSVNIPEYSILLIRKLLILLLLSGAIFSALEFLGIDKFSMSEVIKTEGLTRVRGIFSWQGTGNGPLFNTPVFLIIIFVIKPLGKSFSFESVIILLSALIIVFLSGSRAAILNYLVAFYFIVLRHAKVKNVALLILLIASGFATIKGIGYDFNLFVNERLLDDTTSRTVIYDYALKMFDVNPFFGDGRSGMKGFEDVFAMDYTFGSKVHNGFLRTLINYGLVGFIIFVLWCVLLIREMRMLSIKFNIRSLRAVYIIFILSNFSVDITMLWLMPMFLILIYMKYLSQSKFSVVSNERSLNIIPSS